MYTQDQLHNRKFSSEFHFYNEHVNVVFEWTKVYLFPMLYEIIHYSNVWGTYAIFIDKYGCLITAGVSCGDPPDVSNATFTSDGNLYEDTAMYTCELGFEVSEGVNSWNISCQNTSSWSSGSSCSSKHFQDFH